MVTAQTTAQPSALQRLLPVIGIVVAVAIALGAWLLPLSWLEPGSRAVPPRPGTDSAVTEIAWIQPEAKPWSELIDQIEPLREPDRVPVDDGGGNGGGEGDPLPPPPPDPRVPRPQWSYEGYIEEPGGLVAVVRTNEGQRLIFVGDTITHSPPGFDAVEYTVVEVTPELVRIKHDINEFSYQILRTVPSRMPDTGARRGGRNEHTPATPLPGVSPSELPGGDT